MHNLSCILCKSTNVKAVEELDTHAISNLYKQRAKVDVKRFFKEKSITLCECSDCGLLFYNPIVLGDGKFYEDLQNYEGYYLEEKSDYTEACKYISENDDVLEVGCGAGFFTNFIKYRSYTGLEFNDKAIQIAKSKGLNVKKELLHDHALQNPERYDVVCFFQVLEHVENPHDFLQDALKCLKKGGKLILAVPAEDSFMKESVNTYLNMPPHHATRYPDKTLRAIATLFNIKLHQIIYESIQPIHKEFYVKVKLFAKLRRIFGFSAKKRSLDNSFISNFLYACVWIYSKIFTRFVNFQQIRGVSVVAVYEK